jgi:hypothetical protein
MVALIIGLLLLAFGVWAVLPYQFPMGLNWGPEVITFLMGGGPILAFIIGIIALFIGIADIKDKIEAKKEEQAAETTTTEEKK